MTDRDGLTLAGFVYLSRKLDLILAHLGLLEDDMADLGTELGLEQDAIAALSARIDTITGPLQTALDAANQALADAQAADATDKATIDQLNQQAADALAQVQAHVDELNALAQPAAPPA